MADETKELVVAADYDQLVTLFYTDMYFLALEKIEDEQIAKGITRKVFEVAKKYFDDTQNNLAFLQGILMRMTSYLKDEEEKLQDSNPGE